MVKAESGVVRNFGFLVVLSATLAMLNKPLSALFSSPLREDYHSLIPFIPVVSGYLLYLKRKEISACTAYTYGVGAAVILVGIGLYVAGRTYGGQLNQNDYAFIITVSALVVLVGGFILSYGISAFRATLFPLLFLIFMLPFPVAVMEGAVTFLQYGSTEFANLLFTASGVPFVREGFVFHLPSMSVEVAPQCSGIRSGLALLITAVLAGHLFLNTWWKKVILAVAVIPITMFKNGIRIVTLTLLGAYVDPRILQSSLHREGGIPFFIVALLLMAPVLYFLRRTEGGDRKAEETKRRKRVE